MVEHTPDLVLSRLLQLASPMLPVGAYSYSQGLEWAIECGDVSDATSAQAWIGEVLEIYQRHFELPLLSRLYQAWQAQDLQAVKTWNEFYLAGRDTAEAHAETRQMGYSLVRLLSGLDEVPADFMRQIEAIEMPSFPAVYAGVACLWRIPEAPSIQAFAWSWVENQVGAAMKAVPLGQLAGQRMLLSLGGRLPLLVSHAMGMADDEISNSCPALSIAGCRHETQYSRLFRS